METEFEHVLIEDFEEYVDIHGNSIYPIKTKEQWMLYNIYCFKLAKEEEEHNREHMNDGEIKELLDFWKYTKKQTKKDNTYLCLVKERETYKIMAYYRDKIKKLHSIKGPKVG
jgi:hypothetical protein